MNDNAYVIHIPLPERLQNPKKKHLATAWTKGYVARIAKELKTSCPYINLLSGRAYGIEWENGWDAADNDIINNTLKTGLG